jgi:hypothetical protein
MKQDDPIRYAQQKIIKQIDSSNEIVEGIKELSDSYKYHIDKLKVLISQYLSDELQDDETPMGAMKRNQIRKELLEFASKKV